MYNLIARFSALITATVLGIVPAAAFLHMGVERGLSNGYVTGIAEDSRKNIWIATEEGLNRWDGKRFQNYLPGNSGLTDPELSGILTLPDDPDHVWVASQRNGLFNISIPGYEISHVDAGFRAHDISSLAAARNGGMWIVLYHFGPQFYDPVRNIIHRAVTSAVPDLPKMAWSACEGDDGKLYIGHVDAGFSVVDTVRHTFRNYRAPVLPGNTVYAITPDNNGNIWLGTNRGAAHYNPATHEITPIVHNPDNPTSIGPGAVRDIMVADNGEIWFGTSQGGSPF